jgi:hypothetical protein
VVHAELQFSAGCLITSGNDEDKFGDEQPRILRAELDCFASFAKTPPALCSLSRAAGRGE